MNYKFVWKAARFGENVNHGKRKSKKKIAEIDAPMSPKGYCLNI